MIFPELVLPKIFPLKTEKTVPKSAVRIPKKIPSLYLNSVLKMSAMQITITIPIITSERSTFLLKTKGSRIEAKRVESERQLNAIATLETLMEWKKQNQCIAIAPPIAAS